MPRQSAPFEVCLATAQPPLFPPWFPSVEEGALILAGLALVAWLWRCGVLAPAYLKGTPRRFASFNALDLLAAFGLLIVGQVVAGLLLRAMFGPGPHPAPGQTGWVTLTLQLGSFGPATVWVVARAGRMRNGLGRLGLFLKLRDLWITAKGLPAAWLLSASVLLVSAAVAGALGHESSRVQHSLLKTLQEEPGWGTLVPIVVGAVIVAPICEEVLTRGLLQTLLLRWFGHRLRWTSVALASAAFMMLHVGVVPPQTLPGLFVLGLVFGALYERTGSLVPGILVHAAFNALNVAIVGAGLAG